MTSSDRFALASAWCVELLTEWGSSDLGRLGLRASPMWADSTVDEDGEGEEMRALKAAVSRLQIEQPAEYQEVFNEFKARRSAKATDRATLNVAINRIAAWVDAAMGE